MNLLLLEGADLVGPGRSVVAGERLQHVRKVLRAEVGDTLEVGRLGGGIGRGRVAELNHERLVLDLGSLDRKPPLPLPATLVLALPRPRFTGRILQAATAMGVKRILLVHTARVEKSYWQSSVMRPETLRRHLLLGLAQARDTVLPELACLPRPADLRDALPALVREHDRALVADASAADPCPPGSNESTLLLVGPEGGFLDRELASFKAAGLRDASLGPRALRVEHAIVALLARLGAGA